MVANFANVRKYKANCIPNSLAEEMYIPHKPYIFNIGASYEQQMKIIFDYIFHGKGNEATLSKESGIAAEILREMQAEFLYWYPFDLRVSAKELVPNHLTFCIFHHAALFPPELWPRAIGVNGMLMIEGKQMHKSKGNFVTMKNAVGLGASG